MNPDLHRLQPYPFEKLANLLGNTPVEHNLTPLNISIGEPKHATPAFVREAMIDALDGIAIYPTTRGERALREAISGWICRRFGPDASAIDPDRHVIPVNGTREALFSFAQAVCDRTVQDGVILTPNPFYQIYEGAAFMSGVTPIHVNATAQTGFRPRFQDLDPAILDRAQLLYLCSPSNPTGAVHPLEELQSLIELADRHDFVIASDECYSEIYYDGEPPAGLLQAAWAMGRTDFKRCVVFHSLSKRSNMPGARSGFVAGDAELLARYFQLRTYTGCAQPPFIQHAAIAAWNDETHVADNRALYRAKLDESEAILSPHLNVRRPEASFYLWLEVPGGGERFAQHLFGRYGVTVLPGGYLGRTGDNCLGGAGNPGDPYVRIALVATPEQNREAMQRIAQAAQTFTL
ncbi:succinyldiaminopimelate transaminase [Magnetofaba australis]|uniref:Putative succinyldiaminopimelate transaminase n=1 Tax=Magnetofaba australis IT-1 TaxID=1434232 RepID=A0A1Y2K3I7_9PROT|nr:succinyldiaminopimelate transaminase [Magnetofaba australis]OSM03945.1 putative succinyldiaminopimelate transaminase [Magnetofaba australis IT-1]